MPTTKTRLPFFGQNLILTLTGCYRLGNIGVITLRLQKTTYSVFGAWCGKPNVISRSVAHAKFFSRSRDAVIVHRTHTIPNSSLIAVLIRHGVSGVVRAIGSNRHEHYHSGDE